jgi:hypothetical protein
LGMVLWLVVNHIALGIEHLGHSGLLLLRLSLRR